MSSHPPPPPSALTLAECSALLTGATNTYINVARPKQEWAAATFQGQAAFAWRLLGVFRLEGAAVGVDRFGESAPAADVYKYLGVDAEHLVAAVRSIV